MLLINVLILFITAYFSGKLFARMKLPPLLAYLLIGIFAGTSVVELVPQSQGLLQWWTLSPEIKSISPQMRSFALIIILLRAGLSFQKETLIKIGRSAALISTIPFILEASVVTLLAIYMLDFHPLEAAILAFALAAVSPAVIIPQMLILKAKGIGRKKDVPSLVLAGASVDDILTLTFFWAFIGLGMTTSAESNIFLKIGAIPVSIITGIIGGIALAIILLKITDFFKGKTGLQTCLVIGMAGLLEFIEKTNLFPFAAIIAIIAFGFWINEKNHKIAQPIAGALKHIWFVGEMILFILIGAEVEISALADCGLVGIIILLMGLAGRSIGVWISLIGSHYNKRERLFCVYAFIPKATVQAAIGGIALSYVNNGTLQLANGRDAAETILAIAVLSIVIAAPLGATLISTQGEKLLKENNN